MFSTMMDRPQQIGILGMLSEIELVPDAQQRGFDGIAKGDLSGLP